VSLEWTLLALRIASAVILYAFLGLAFFIIWRDLKQADAPNRPEIRHHLRVVASAGDDTSLAAGDILPLRPVTSVGRAAGNTVILADAAASGQHARLRQDNGLWWLEDLGSKNGTTLNDLPLSRPASLTEGDVIGIGSLRLKFETDTNNL
jgi:hypothetical protein